MDARDSFKLSDPKVINWFRVCLAFKAVRSPFLVKVEQTVRILYDKLLRSPLCGSCSTKPINKQSNWRLNCTEYDVWVDAIQGKMSTGLNCFWKNTNRENWTTDYWEIAKVWIPNTTDANTSPEKTDCSKILQLYKNCTLFNASEGEKENLQQVIDIRNELSHSPDMELLDEETDEYFVNMIKLLSANFLPGEEAADARRKLEELSCAVEFSSDQTVIVLEETKKIMFQVVEAIRQDNEELKDDIRGILQRFDMSSEQTLKKILDVLKELNLDKKVGSTKTARSRYPLPDGQFLTRLKEECANANVKHTVTPKEKEVQDNKPVYVCEIHVPWTFTTSQGEEQQTKVDAENKLAEYIFTRVFPNKCISFKEQLQKEYPDELRYEPKENDKGWAATLTAQVSAVGRASRAGDAREMAAQVWLKKLGFL